MSYVKKRFATCLVLCVLLSVFPLNVSAAVQKKPIYSASNKLKLVYGCRQQQVSPPKSILCMNHKCSIRRGLQQQWV